MIRFSRRLALAACVALLGPTSALAAAKTVISMSGSTSMYQLAISLSNQYVKRHRVGFRILQGGSDAGVNDVADGRVTIADSSRDPSQGVDPHGLYWYKVARYPMCVITNPANPLTTLSKTEVQAIFDGSVTEWAQVPGAGVSGPIDPYTRTGVAADPFKQIFLGSGFSVAQSAISEPSNGVVREYVRADPNGVGAVPVALTRGVHSVAYQGAPCSHVNAKIGTYPGVDDFWMVTRGAARGAARSFIKWILFSKSARKIINSHWLPPL
jgi:phosphate transport system substrate-binding protein